jgi:hypothetical protein
MRDRRLLQQRVAALLKVEGYDVFSMRSGEPMALWA